MNAWENVVCIENKSVLWSTLAFNVKHFPHGLIKNFRTQFCVRRGQQIEGIDFFEAYVSLAQWTTICLMHILKFY